MQNFFKFGRIKEINEERKGSLKEKHMTNNDVEFSLKQLNGIINHEYNDLIGGNENSYLDGEEFYPYTLEELVEDITNTILTSKEYLEIENSKMVVEQKHIRFLGKDFIRNLVYAICLQRKSEEGKWIWEK